MLGAITSLVRNTLHHRCRLSTSLTLRSHLRHFVSSPLHSEKSDWDGMIVAKSKVDQLFKEGVEQKSPDERWQMNSQTYENYRKNKAPATTYSGRSVPVTGGNVADAYGRLQSVLQRNRVQVQLRQTERHEKKGVKRRRLSSERWRKQFAHEVRKKVQLVAKIRSRGA